MLKIITHQPFSVLRAFAEEPGSSQRLVSRVTGISLGAVNKTVGVLRGEGLLDADNKLTPLGVKTLKGYRVQGAVILAAGLSARLAPLSYEHPKPLFTVHGEVLIERMIRQLQEVGIERITVVVGHMKEQLFYLEDEFGVELLEACDYRERNNHSSVFLAGERILGSYVCCSDQFYPENPFHAWEYSLECMAVLLEDSQSGTAVELDGQGRVKGCKQAAAGKSWYLLGPSFIDAESGRKLLAYISEEYNRPETAGALWERILLAHIEDFTLRTRRVPPSAIREFDRMEDLCSFDSAFLENVDSAILDNICSVLHCSRLDIGGVRPLQEGITNLSVVFSCKGDNFVYRHPGVGTGEIINRQAEAFALNAAAELGLDSTFVYEDASSGWKISRLYETREPFSYSNRQHVEMALRALRQLHDGGVESPWSFDFYDEANRLLAQLESEGFHFPADFYELKEVVDGIAGFVYSGAGQPVLCHNDFYGPNILVGDGEVCLIDWEYAAMGDYGCDLGNFVAQGSGYSVSQALEILPLYFGREATEEEKAHLVACTAVVGWYWYVWALFKEQAGSSTGNWMRIWYKAAKDFGRAAAGLVDGRPSAPAELSRGEFDVLVALEAGGRVSEQDGAVVAELAGEGLVNEGGITVKGLAALEPYRARRAIFFAAGFGSRMLPITINTPKPLVRVWGERIIDRLLDAVTAVGIEEIYIVRGYLKDAFDQLKSKYPSIKFLDNPIYDSTNNISSALQAKDFFQNAYVFESDLLLRSPELITKYQYRSNYLAIPVDQTEDWCFSVDGERRITRIAKGSEEPCWQMVGVSYWTAKDGGRLSRDIPAVFNQDEGAKQIFWDDVALDRRPEEYKVHVRECSFNDVAEIDSFRELQEVDEAYRTLGGL